MGKKAKCDVHYWTRQGFNFKTRDNQRGLWCDFDHENTIIIKTWHPEEGHRMNKSSIEIRLKEHGISWQGTVDELAAQLRKEPVAAPCHPKQLMLNL